MSKAVGQPARERREVDARGLRCPLPVLRLAAALRAEPPGSLVVLLATDPATKVDVPAFARMRKVDVLEITDHGDHTAYLVRVPEPSAPPATETPVSRSAGPRPPAGPSERS